MPPSRALLPSTALPVTLPSSFLATIEPRVATKQRQRHTAMEWESKKGTIIQLYQVEGKKAKDVLSILESEFGFNICLRQLNNKLKEWKVVKNTRRCDETRSDSQDARENIIVTQPVNAFIVREPPSPDDPMPDISFEELSEPAAQPLQSNPSYMDETQLPDSLQFNYISPDMIDYNTPRLLFDDGEASTSPHLTTPPLEIHPLAITSRSEPFEPDTLSLFPGGLFGQGSSDPSPDGWLRLDFSSFFSGELQSELRSQPQSPGLPVDELSDSDSHLTSSFKRSLSQVIQIISKNEGTLSNSIVSALKNHIEIVLTVSQNREEKPNKITSSLLHRSRRSLNKRLSLVKNLVGSASTFTLKNQNTVKLPWEISTLIRMRITGKFRSKTFRLGSNTLTVTEKTSTAFSDQPEWKEDDPVALRQCVANVVIKPDNSASILQIEVQQLQMSFGGIYSLPPKLLVKNIVPNGSQVFDIAKNGSADDFLKLFSTGQASLQDCNEHGASLLHYAVSNASVCKLLVESGLDVDEVIHEDRWETTPLIEATLEGSIESFEILLNAGADPIMASKGAKSPLYWVASGNTKNKYECLKLIFNLSPQLGLKNLRIFPDIPILLANCAFIWPGETPINPEDKLKFLVDRGCRVTDTCAIGSCLHMFFRLPDFPPGNQSWLKALIYLVQNGADVYSLDNWGTSVSQIAYSEPICGQLRWEKDLGSYRGDLWDAVLHSCGYDLASFRRNRPRTARYTNFYRREDFEKLWVGQETLCPYWEDNEWPAPKQDRRPGVHATRKWILCTCSEDGPTIWIDAKDAPTHCHLIVSEPKDSDTESDCESELDIVA
ncbi:hypothetical protein F4777DRAFT_520468 [Nemania sp. FL0916]|nr:hypothetical protein F4777DRAFT_520468 [Nemania sp. FL0916]